MQIVNVMETEADKLRNSIQYGLGVMDAGSGEFKELSDKIDELFELSYLEGQSNPSIKQLEWVRYSYGREISETPIGNFYIDVPNHGKIRMALVEAFCGYFDSVAEAKSQAQKIFERRVKACLNI